MMKRTGRVLGAMVLSAMTTVASARADDLVRLAAGIFKRHGLELQAVYTSGGGETQQAVISGSVDIGVSAGSLGVLSVFVKGAPVRIIAGEATGTAEYYFVRTDLPLQ